VAVAAMQPPAVVYREEQNFDWWVYALVVILDVAVLGALAWYSREGADAAGPVLPRMSEFAVLAVASVLLVPVILIMGVLRMTTEVTATHARVWFGWIPTYRRVFPVAAVQRLEVVSYRPIADYGGWGIRRGRDGERVLNARGNRGVRLDLSDGTRLLIGSQRPEALAAALERAMRPGV
jgi:hypothetical protein